MLRDAVVDGYAIMTDIVEDMAAVMEEAGADVTMTQTSLEEIDAMFASEPYAEIDIFTTEEIEVESAEGVSKYRVLEISRSDM